MNCTPTTSPSSYGATSASATVASLTPKDLSGEYEAVDTAAKLSPYTLSSMPLFSPKNADAYAAENDNSNQNRLVNNRNHRGVSRLESVMGLKQAEGRDANHDLSQIMCGCMFAFVVLGIWIWTNFQFIVLINRHQCTAAFTDLGAKAVSAASNVGSSNNLGMENATMSCLHVHTGTLACAHSITFGLISAVVIHETGSSDESAKQRLTSMIKPIVKRQKLDANFFQQSVFTLITSLPTVYVVSWTIFGLTCFVYSLTQPDGSTGPLFYTGQAWIGLIIKVTYSFFGVEPQNNASTPSTPQTHLGRQWGRDV